MASNRAIAVQVGVSVAAVVIGTLVVDAIRRAQGQGRGLDG